VSRPSAPVVLVLSLLAYGAGVPAQAPVSSPSGAPAEALEAARFAVIGDNGTRAGCIRPGPCSRTSLISVPFVLLPVLQLSQSSGTCRLEMLTPLTMEEQAMTQFDHAVDQYVALHRRLERSLPPERIFDDAEEMFAARDALRSAILAARPHARQGNIFTAGVARAFVDNLERAIEECGHDPADILADINAERLPGTRPPQVNGEYPWGVGSSMWPTLLRALPELPAELEYRFSDRDLVLIDVHANLVVDILEDALPQCRDGE
jgi:hypothetical protein